MSRQTLDTTSSPKPAPTISDAEAEAVITDIATRRPDLLVRHPLFTQPPTRITPTVTDEQRKAALLELATLANEEEGRASKPLSDAIDLIVPALASPFCDQPVEVFWQLVEAVEQRRLFRSDETEYAVKHERGTSAEALANLEDALQGDVDLALARLLGAMHPAVTKAVFGS